MFTDHLHPLTVHFPIALLMVGFLFDFLSLIFKKEHCLSKAGFWLLILGSLGALAAYLTGEFFSRPLDGPLGEKKEFHELFAKLTMYSMLGLSVLRIILVLTKKDKGGMKWLILLLYLGGAGLVGYTGLLGGSLVYDNLIGAPINTDSLSTDTTSNIKTVKNLQAGVKGETTASAKYNAFANKALEEGYPAIASLFKAAAEAEKVHIGSFTNALAKLNVKAETVVPEFTVGTTLENLEAAINGETEENTKIYAGFVKDAENDKLDDAATTFGYVMEVEGRHSKLFQAALDKLKSGKDVKKQMSYSTCPVCGFIYETAQLPENCEMCGTPKAQFIAFKL